MQELDDVENFAAVGEDRAHRDHPRQTLRVAVVGLQHHHAEDRLVAAVEHRGSAEAHLDVAGGRLGEQLHEPAARPAGDRQLHPPPVGVPRGVPVAPDARAALQLGAFDQRRRPGAVPRLGQPQQRDVASRLGLVPVEPGSPGADLIPGSEREVQPHLGPIADHVRAGQDVLAVQQEARAQQDIRPCVEPRTCHCAGSAGVERPWPSMFSTVERPRTGIPPSAQHHPIGRLRT
nr:hypothetical protein [Saccharopolyspora sp. ASAGF58]